MVFGPVPDQLSTGRPVVGTLHVLVKIDQRKDPELLGVLDMLYCNGPVE